MKSSDVAIASPCHEDWDAMAPEGTRRFCDRCDKHVHDLSALTEDDARALLASAGQSRLCVRYRANAAGEIVFAPPTNVVPLGALRRRRVAASLPAAAGLAMALAACTPHDDPDARPTPTIGDREVVGEPIARPDPRIPDEPDALPMMGAVAVDPEPPPVVKMGEAMPIEDQPDADEPCDPPPTPETKPSPEPKPERPMVKMGKVVPRSTLESLGEAH